MTNVHVVGASGYAAAELIRLLAVHPDVSIASIESSSSAGARMCDIFPSLPAIELVCSPSGSVREQRPARRRRVPGRQSRGRARTRARAARCRRAGDRSLRRVSARPDIPKAPCTVCPSAIALRSRRARSSPIPVATSRRRCSRWFRSDRSATGSPPSSSMRRAALPVRAAIRKCRRCSPRSPKTCCPMASTATVISRRSSQEARAAGIDAPIVFSPHVVPLRRGIFADVYLVPRAPISREEVEALYTRFYANDPFVSVFTDKRVPNLPARRENQQRPTEGHASGMG